MRLTKRVVVTCGVAMAAAVLPGCETLIFPFDPCPDTKTIADDGTTQTVGKVEDVGQMDWVWVLESVGSRPLPFANPTELDESVVRLELHFDTDVTDRGSDRCDDVKRTRGTTVAIATTRENGVNKTQRFGGTFTRNHVTNETTLSYGPYQLPIHKDGFILTTRAGEIIGPVNRGSFVFVLSQGLELKFIRTKGPGGRIDNVSAPTVGVVP